MKQEILGVKAPKKKCTDSKCPFHGQLNVKKELVTGIIIRRDAHHSATIEWKRSHFIPKYERYEMRRSRLRVHNPPCIDAQIGQEVLAARTRPLSKTKNHVVIQIVNTDKKLKPSSDSISEKKETKSKAKETKIETQNEVKQEEKQEKEDKETTETEDKK